MGRRGFMMRVAYVSTFPPRKCGIATYTTHLREAVQKARLWKGMDPVIVLSDEGNPIENCPWQWPLQRDQQKAYVQMAQRVNKSNISIVSLQHEFGIFGGEAGCYILDFIRHLQKPLVTTFHTVFAQPEEPYRSIQREIARRSERIIVMNRQAIAYLRDAFQLPEEKIIFLPHGTPVPQPEMREKYRKKWGWDKRKVIMTFGLLSRGKGIERVIDVLPQVVAKVPDVLYAIVGQTHPEVKKREGETYRAQLLEMIRDRHLENHVQMIDRFLSEDDLVEAITACDLYITPYPGLQQITSGTLAYAVGLGRTVLSTPYVYAQDLLRGHEELLIPYEDSAGWEEKITRLLADPAMLKSWEEKIERIGKAMQWPLIGRKHSLLFLRTVEMSNMGKVLQRGEGIVPVTG